MRTATAQIEVDLIGSTDPTEDRVKVWCNGVSFGWFLLEDILTPSQLKRYYQGAFKFRIPQKLIMKGGLE